MTPFERASEAKQLLDNRMLQQALSDMRLNLVAKLERSDVLDIETQHNGVLMLQLLRGLKDQLWSYLNEQAMIEAKEKHESFVQKMKGRIT